MNIHQSETPSGCEDLGPRCRSCEGELAYESFVFLSCVKCKTLHTLRPVTSAILKAYIGFNKGLATINARTVQRGFDVDLLGRRDSVMRIAGKYDVTAVRVLWIQIKEAENG